MDQKKYYFGRNHMKKLLSVFLAVLMLAGACCMSIAAADPSHVVGTHGVNKNTSDGADSIGANASSSSDVKLTVGTVTHKYAVDVVFEDLTFSVSGIVWNVNDLQYELANGVSLKDKTYTITVNNYSDLDVSAKTTATLNSSLPSDNGLSLALVNDSIDTVKTVSHATPANGSTQGTAGSVTVQVKLSSADWSNSVKALINNGTVLASAPDITVGTVTVTISAVESTPVTPAP